MVTYTVVVVLVAIILIKNVMEILNNKGDLVVALVVIILIKNIREILKFKDSLFQWHSPLFRTHLYMLQLIFVFPLF